MQDPLGSNPIPGGTSGPLTELVHPRVLTLAGCEELGSACPDRRRNIDTAGHDDVIACGEKRLHQRDERADMPQRRGRHHENLPSQQHMRRRTAVATHSTCSDPDGTLRPSPRQHR
jgi:hypothetical protein